MPWNPGELVGAAVPVPGSVGLPLESVSGTVVGDPGARALVLGDLDDESDKEFGPPEDDVGVDEGEGVGFAASPKA